MIARREMFVGLTEAFDDSIVLLRALRAPDLDIRYAPVNVAKSSRIAKDLLEDPGTRAMIVEANQADLQLYRHAKEELFPAMERDYGPSLTDSVVAFREGQAKRRHLATYGLKQRLVLQPAMKLYRRSSKHEVVDVPH